MVQFMLLCEALTLAQANTSLVAVVDEQGAVLFDGTVSEVSQNLTSCIIKEIGVFDAYSNCLQVVIFTPIIGGYAGSDSEPQDAAIAPGKAGARKPRTATVFGGFKDLPFMISVYDLMDFFRCGQKQAYELAHSVGFPSMKVGSSIQVPKHLFIKWLEDQTKGQLP